MDDFAAQELLERVTDEWAATGVLRVLRELVGQVWRTDLARYDPALGDDAMSLGMQASRNLCNLTVRRLQGMRGVLAKDRRTLEVTYAGRVLHVGKAPSDSPTWDVTQVDWADSEVREHAAAANSAAYQSSSGTLFENWSTLPGQYLDPAALRHLHLTWQGLADGSTRTWLGFPQLGSRPWFAVLSLDDARLGGAQFGDARFGDARLGDARLDDARLDDARLDDAGFGDAQIRGLRFGDGAVDLTTVTDAANSGIPILRHTSASSVIQPAGE